MHLPGAKAGEPDMKPAIIDPIEIALREDVTQGMLEDLRSGLLDIAIANIPDPEDHPDLIIVPLGSDEVALGEGSK